ncbi:MAG: UDP-N-acetylmuramoyl-L-alanyl-D-glutamate--2,6-diaminopimelate ligase [Acidobacteria bacterium]|nr:UDP-N-acetylmuramoyl-L-alanyl-D-glutamate--2,6-diaminopimelate ligase [Acidobacteriota bacterium]
MVELKKMKSLKEVLQPSDLFIYNNQKNISISGVKYDSRKVEKNDLFVAISGYKTDGNIYIDDAVEHGAVAIVTDHKQETPLEAVWIENKNPRRALSIISANYYEHPSERINLIGITGTNGKTTTTYIIQTILETLHQKAGVIGTIGYQTGKGVIKSSRTTPEAPEINQFLSDMLAGDFKYCIMEASSHALVLDRVTDLKFKTAIFTNLTNDHLDYHNNLEDYYQAKKKLFGLLRKDGVIVLNIDDDYGKRLKEELTTSDSKIITYGLAKDADINILEYELMPLSSRLKISIFGEVFEFDTQLLGLANIFNLAAAIATTIAEGFDYKKIIEGAGKIKNVPGRMERVEAGQKFKVIVDYAHTPDALRQLLMSVRQITDGKVITVFGCGGDRDKTKRPMMGKHAAHLSDFSIVTNDNPRTEEPGAIIRDILTGMRGETDEKNYTVIEDRAQAISNAILMAEKNDTVVLAGKGHEDYQIIGATVSHFDDREVAREFLLKQEAGD